MKQSGQHGVAVVEVLLKAAPLAAATRNAVGSLPLHVAARFQGGERGTAVLEALLAAGEVAEGERGRGGGEGRGRRAPRGVAALSQGG